MKFSYFHIELIPLILTTIIMLIF